nr:uncharacterized protein LOC116831187 isoform X1 [Chelonoidis abingdonii]
MLVQCWAFTASPFPGPQFPHLMGLKIVPPSLHSPRPAPLSLVSAQGLNIVTPSPPPPFSSLFSPMGKSHGAGQGRGAGICVLPMFPTGGALKVDPLLWMSGAESGAKVALPEPSMVGSRVSEAGLGGPAGGLSPALPLPTDSAALGGQAWPGGLGLAAGGCRSRCQLAIAPHARTQHGGYTPLHIAALHGHRQVMDLLIQSYGAKQNVRDYSGHLARHYLGAEKPRDRAATLPHLPAVRGRNRALACLPLPKGSGQARKRWGSAEDLTEEEERGQAQHLTVPASYRAVRKFSR